MRPHRSFIALSVVTTALGAVLLSAGCDSETVMPDDTTISVEDENLKTISQYIEEFKNKANHDIVYTLFADDFVHHLPDPALPPGREGMVLLGQAVHGGFPDVHVTVEDLIAADDMVVERTTAQGTHTGTFQGVPATDRPVTWTEIHIYRLANGKVVEYWPEVDLLAILIQIGAVPPPGA